MNALNSLQSNFATIEAVRKSGNRKNVRGILEMAEWARRIGYKVCFFTLFNFLFMEN